MLHSPRSSTKDKTPWSCTWADASAAAFAATKAAAKAKAREGVKTLWVNGRVQIISLEEGDRAEAQEVDLHRAEYGTKWMLAQRGE